MDGLSPTVMNALAVGAGVALLRAFYLFARTRVIQAFERRRSGDSADRGDG